MYTQDYDEYFYPHRWSTGKDQENPFCAQYSCSGGPIGTTDGTPPETGGQITGQAEERIFWVSLLQPYTKSYGVFMCPDAPNAWVGFNPAAVNCGGGTGSTQASGCDGVSYGGQNSYAHNDFWMSPAGQTAAVAVPSNAQVARPTSTLLVTDGTYYGGGPDLFQQSGVPITYGTTPAASAVAPDGGNLLTEDQAYVGNSSTTGQGTAGYPSYWENVGNATFGYHVAGGAWTAPTAASSLSLGQLRHSGGFVNCQFVDGHVKAIKYTSLIGNMCYWVIDSPIHAAKSGVNPSHAAYCN
jgi:prepilin-type processing-associated H-X9-DG protein